MSAEETTKKPEEGTTPAEEKEGTAKEEESTAHFEPVVKLDEVDTKTGEEDEKVLHSVRSKLFIFGETLLDKGTGKKSWRERGIGNCRILQHKEHQRVRVLMRQEKTMKVICNFALDPRIKLAPNAGSDRSWVWSAFDFSGGDLEETVFALRFADSDVANAFQDKFAEGQSIMEKLLAGEDSAEGTAEADDAAAALEGLKTSDDDKKEE